MYSNEVVQIKCGNINMIRAGAFYEITFFFK